MTQPTDTPQGTPVPPRKGKKGSRPAQASPARKGNATSKSTTPGKSGSGSNRARSASAARQAKRRRNILAGVGIAAVVVIVALVVGLGINSNASAKPAPRVALTADQSVALQSVPVNDLVAAFDKSGSGLNPATQLSHAPLTANGKPEVLFIGAEFCPICATERWPLTVALSQFGKFTNLHQTRSAVHDGNIATLTYYGSTYSSSYLTFTPVETTTNIPKGNYYELLQTPTAAQNAIWSSTSQELGVNEGFPFVYMGGKYVLTTAQFDPTTLEGKSFDDILNAVGNNDTTIGANIDASAAALTKYFCTLTGDKPASACDAVTNLNAPVSSSSSGSNSPAGG